MRIDYRAVPVIAGLNKLLPDGRVWVPIAQVTLSQKHRRTSRQEVIVDSGAPCCLFHSDLLTPLRIALPTGEPGTLGGIVGGAQLTAYYHRVTLEIYGNAISIVAGFSNQLPIAGVLGRNGFFDHFTVTFDPTLEPPGMEIERYFRA